MLFIPRCSASPRSTPTNGSSQHDRVRPRRHRRRLRRSSTPGTSPAKRPRTRTHGRSSRRAYAAFNRHELPATTPDWVNIDHRRGAAFAPGDLTAYVRAPGTSRRTSHATSRRASAERPRSGRHPCGVMGPRRGLRSRVAAVTLLTVDGDLINRNEIFDEADLDAALADSTNSAGRRRRLENAASRVVRALLDVLRGPRLGRHGGDDGRRHLQRRSSTGGERRDPTRSRCRNRESACRCRPRSHEHDVDRHRDPRGAPRPQSYPLLGPRSAARRVPHRDARRHRDRRRQSDRRHASCSTSTTSTPPSRNSTPDTSPARPPPTRTHGRSSRRRYAALNRHELPATTPD